MDVEPFRYRIGISLTILKRMRLAADRLGMSTAMQAGERAIGGIWARIVALSTNRRAGYVLLGACALSFAALALIARFADTLLLHVDRPIHYEVLESREGWLNQAMAMISLLGTRYVIGLFLVGLAGWVLITGRCRKALFVLVAAFVANFALEAILKQTIARPRPDTLRLVPGNGPSFPSGHVVATVGFYGVLAVVAWKSTWQRWARAGAYLAASAVILAVGYSRIYLGVHWFSDVMGGFLVGTIFVLGVTRFLRGHHLARDRCCDPAPA